jgi:uncharacterized protein (DUF1015 family)
MVKDKKKIKQLQDVLYAKTMVITDGHHRYESAITYRDEMRKKGNCTKDSAFNFHMSYMVPVEEEGLVVLPTHRLLKDYKLTDDLLDTSVDTLETTEDCMRFCSDTKCILVLCSEAEE